MSTLTRKEAWRLLNEYNAVRNNMKVFYDQIAGLYFIGRRAAEALWCARSEKERDHITNLRNMGVIEKRKPL